jgi:hypothetical protein
MEQAWSDRARPPGPLLAAEAHEARLPWRKSNTPEMMLALVFGDGTRRAYPYYTCEGMDVVTKGVLKLYFVRATVVIEGYELEELADLLARHCVSVIRQQPEAEEFTLPPGTPFVKKLWILPPNLEALARRPVE